MCQPFIWRFNRLLFKESVKRLEVLHRSQVRYPNIDIVIGRVTE